MRDSKRLTIKELFLESIKELSLTKHIAICGMMGALSIILSFVATISIGDYLRIGFSGFPNRIVDFLFGPAVGGIFGGIMDIVKFILKPTGAFFPGYTISAILGGLVYGSILYKRPVTPVRILIAEIIVKVFINIGLNSLWTVMLTGKAFMVIMPARVIKNLVSIVVDTILLTIILKTVEKIKVTL